jgi:hypothetical protein
MRFIFRPMTVAALGFAEVCSTLIISQIKSTTVHGDKIALFNFSLPSQTKGVFGWALTCFCFCQKPTAQPKGLAVTQSQIQGQKQLLRSSFSKVGGGPAFTCFWVKKLPRWPILHHGKEETAHRKYPPPTAHQFSLSLFLLLPQTMDALQETRIALADQNFLAGQNQTAKESIICLAALLHTQGNIYSWRFT